MGELDHCREWAETMLTRREAVIGAMGAAILMRSRTSMAKAAQPATAVNFGMPVDACDCHTHIHGDMRELPWTNRFDAAYCWGNSFAYFEHRECRRFLKAVAASLNVALLWPLTNARYFAPFTPIPVAPIGRGLLSMRGFYVLCVEALWFSPCFAYVLWNHLDRMRHPRT